MTELTAPKSPLTANEFADEIRQALKYTQGVTPEQAKTADVYVATATVVRRHLMDSWMKTQQDMINGDTKAVGYLSAEFLMGKQLRNALLNAGLTPQFEEAVRGLGFDPQAVVDAEYEPGLGNGGLGRLAACFIDSLASLGVPAFGSASSTSTASSARNSMTRVARSSVRTTGCPMRTRGGTSTTSAISASTSAARSSRRTASVCGSRAGPCARSRWTTWCPATPRVA